MWTYDQPVPLIMCVSFGVGLVILVRRQAAWTSVTFLWGGTGLLFLANIAAKLNDPQNGPKFGVLDAHHFWLGAWDSYEVSFGSKFQKELLSSDIQSVLTPQILFLAAGVGLCVATIAMHVSRHNGSGERSYYGRIWHPATILGFGLAAFFMAYLPNYFWFISGRHNYLPSAAIALAVAAIASLMFRWFRGQRTGAAAQVGLGILVGCFIVVFSVNILGFKELFLRSYEVRKEFFQDAAKYVDTEGGTMVVLWGFPRYFGEQVAVFAYEKNFALEILTKGAAKIALLAEGGVAGFGRIFYATETEVTGGVVLFKFVATRDFIFATSGGMNKDRHRYGLVRKAATPEYKIQRVQDAAGGAVTPAIEFDIPVVALAEGEILVALPMQTGGTGTRPLAVDQINGLSTLALSEVPCHADCAGAWRLEDARLVGDIASVSVYISTASGPPRLIDTVAVTRR